MNFLQKETMPMTCVNDECNRCGIQIVNGAEKCRDCGGDLYPWDEVDFRDIDDDTALIPGDIQAELFKASDRFDVEHPTTSKQVIAEDDTFSCPPDLTGCPIAERCTVRIPLAMFNKWIFLARQIDTEWIAYLIGSETNPGTYTITDMYFPKQKANGTHCEAEDGEIKPDTVATVHSHVGMSAFFSAEDQKHFNHAVEMVINRDGDIVANGRTKLACGRYHRGKADVKFIDCDDELVAEKELREKIAPERSTGFVYIADHPRERTASR